MTPTVEGPNHELFVQVLAQIEREPQRWNQSLYVTSCGTAHCFAGWACQLNGKSIDHYGFVGLGDSRTLADDAADKSLNIDGWEAGLYCGDNSLDDLYRISADILGIDEQVLREKVAAEVACGSVQP